MKVFYSAAEKNVVIERSGRLFASGSLFAVATGQIVRVFYNGSNQAELAVRFNRIQRENGDPAGSTAAEVVAYLNGQFTQDPFSGGGGSTIPEVNTDPASPTVGQAWVLKTIVHPVGVLQAFVGTVPLLTTQETPRFDFSYRTTDGTRRAQLL